MKICTAIDDMRAASRSQRSAGKRLGLVPTMGALHEGHLSLVRAARAQYPPRGRSLVICKSSSIRPRGGSGKISARPGGRDRALFEKEGVDFLFTPSVEEMYPAGAVTYVTVQGLSDKLCGRSRPGHFRG